MVGSPGCDRQRCHPQGGHRCGAAHVNRGGKPQIARTEIGRQLFGLSDVREGQNTVDFLALQACVLERSLRGPQLNSQLAHARAGLAAKIGLADADDARFILDHGSVPSYSYCPVSSMETAQSRQ